MKKSFANICRVSALDNFAFIFHYFNVDIKTFIKKTAKYIARISHACSIIKLLKRNISFNLTYDNMVEFANLGNHTYITNKYKTNTTSIKDKKYIGLLSKDFEILLDNASSNNTSPTQVLISIYNILISGNFGITPKMLCIVPKINIK